MTWSPQSWRDCEARQQPDYPDPEALAAAERELSAYAPLVPIEQVDRLRSALAEAQAGRAFLLQGGDCAESFAEFSPANIDAKADLLDAMAAPIGASGLEVIRVGRMAGQFAKPRSAAMEVREGLALPAYRGDIVNSLAFDAAARRPDPERMFRAYAQAAATLARLRDRAIFVSHEALLLPFEESLVRVDPESGRPYASSAHFLWIGDRTRFAGSAHVEFARGLANPIGIKCGPSLDPEMLRRLLAILDPGREPGRITLIGRFGHDRIESRLPPLLRTIAAEGHPVLWVCDPMHGNTIASAEGKTRLLSEILAETRAFFAVARAEGVRPGGLHFEMTGREVAECRGEEAQAGRYDSHCDPRLNPKQAMQLAALVAGELAGLAPAV